MRSNGTAHRRSTTHSCTSGPAYSAMVTSRRGRCRGSSRLARSSRLGSRVVAGSTPRRAWLTVVVMAVNPYMIRYATEARMYSLQILLVACGLVVVPRACERPSFGRLGSVALVTALLVYTHYWSFSLVGVTLGAVLFASWRAPERRRPLLLVAASIVVGLLAFLPWLPTFLFQRAHTGTPWGDATLPGIPIGTTLLGFSGGERAGGLGPRVRAGRTRPRRRVRACGGRATARSRHPRATVGARARRSRGSDACCRHESRLPRRTGVPVARTARSCSRSSHFCSPAGSRC